MSRKHDLIRSGIISFKEKIKGDEYANGLQISQMEQSILRICSREDNY